MTPERPMSRRPIMPRRSPTRFGANMRRLRDERHWSQKTLAERCNRSRATVAKHESGAFQSYEEETVKAVAAAFGVSVAELLKDPEEWAAHNQAEQSAPPEAAAALPLPPGLEAYLHKRAYDITAREADELKSFSFRLKRSQPPGVEFWEQILAALRSLPPRDGGDQQ